MLPLLLWSGIRFGNDMQQRRWNSLFGWFFMILSLVMLLELTIILQVVALAVAWGGRCSSSFKGLSSIGYAGSLLDLWLCYARWSSFSSKGMVHLVHKKSFFLRELSCIYHRLSQKYFSCVMTYHSWNCAMQ